MTRVPRPILLFDGQCALCNSTVRWLIRHDDGCLHYAPLESTIGRSALGEVEFNGDVTSVVLIDSDGGHQYSEAAWRILRLLPWPWRAGWALRLMPRFARDAAYRFIARNRYRLFGRSERCSLGASLSPSQQERIIGSH